MSSTNGSHQDVRGPVLNEERLGLAVVNELMSRVSSLNKSLDPDRRDVNYDCGYPDSISLQNYKDMFDRNGIAGRVVSGICDEAWKVSPEVYEVEDPSKETAFEKAWKALVKKHQIYHYLHRADVLSGIGHFGILLIGLDDGGRLSDPAPGLDPDTGEMVELGEEFKLTYLMPYDETSVVIERRNRDESSPRFNQPEQYSIVTDEPGLESNMDRGDGRPLRVHWSRVLHLVRNRQSNNVYGTPEQQNVYNWLLDLRKELGADAEAMWKGGFPGFSLESNADNPFMTQEEEDKTKQAWFEYENSLRRFVINLGLQAKPLSSQITDPTPHFMVLLMAISIAKNIPMRVLMGSEEGKLASTQDSKNWNNRVMFHRRDYEDPWVLRPFVDRLMAYRVLPRVDPYFTHWPDLNAMADQDKSNIAQKNTDALASYVESKAYLLVPPVQYLTLVWGMDLEEATATVQAGAKLTGANKAIVDAIRKWEKEMMASKTVASRTGGRQGGQASGRSRRQSATGGRRQQGG